MCATHASNPYRCKRCHTRSRSKGRASPFRQGFVANLTGNCRALAPSERIAELAARAERGEPLFAGTEREPYVRQFRRGRLRTHC